MGIVVFSPHLDDAVLSVGQVIAAAEDVTVVTVFAGVSPSGAAGEFDRQCGFVDSRTAITHRRQEDCVAIGLLGARAVHLDFPDRQYGHSVDDAALVDRLAETLERAHPSVVLGPVGLGHPDHRQLGRVWPLAARRIGIAARAYEELPYRVKSPNRTRRAVREFVRVHDAIPARLPSADVGRKAHAILAYASQLRWVFPLDCLQPERLWRMWD
jgi:LmbE family N-acetylglucosaminyl deacetylase